MLWLVPSLFFIATGWPTIAATTWGSYIQPTWSSTTGVCGASHLPFGRPAFTQTNALLTVPFLLSTISSDGAPCGCARVQKGVADMSSILTDGLEPVKATFPVMVAPFSSGWRT